MINDGFSLYHWYSCVVGLSERKSTQRRTQNDEKKVSPKYFLCSCAGFNAYANPKKVVVEDTSPHGKKKRKARLPPHPWKGCNVLLQTKINEDAKYVVVGHVVASSQLSTSTYWISPLPLIRTEDDHKKGGKQSTECNSSGINAGIMVFIFVVTTFCIFMIISNFKAKST